MIDDEQVAGTLSEIEEASKTIEADRRNRLKVASEAVERALKDNHCDLVATPQISSDGRVVAIVQIVAR